MDKQEIIVSNIQRFSLHDGPGLRTTVFLKGCDANCPWCCNPENISKNIETYRDEDGERTYGKYYSAKDLYDELIKDKNFFDEGGVTFSGGEPLLQASQLKQVIEMLKEEGIHLAAETSLFCSEKQIKLALDFFDLFYVDIKIADEKTSKEITGIDTRVYFNNLKILLGSGKPVILRFPYVPEFTDGSNIDQLISKLNELDLSNVSKIEILKGHQLGKDKHIKVYGSCNNFYSSKIEICDEELNRVMEQIRKSLCFSGEVKVNKLQIPDL